MITLAIDMIHLGRCVRTVCSIIIINVDTTNGFVVLQASFVDMIV